MSVFVLIPSHSLLRKIGMALARASLVLPGLVMIAWGGLGFAADRHVGYYYPEPETQEVYQARANHLPEIGRVERIRFITDMMNQIMDAPYAPRYSLFPKGADAEKAIIIALENDSLNTLYRMRGLLALLTARARETEIFKELQVVDSYTFLDLLKLLGFELLTISDGENLAHQIVID